ncbi:MAG: CNNM domain-containing protein [Salinibacter sp.]|uniref:CNNM domain-containing protein n=1 Tax=Salinibacter sp. TaxID=2065818 RepID=UPI0035D47543
MTWITAFQLLGGAILLLGNAFFVTTEFALTRVRQFDEQDFQQHAGLRRAWEMTEELEIYLSGCQVGITVCSIGLGVVGEPGVTHLIGNLLPAGGIGAVATHTISVTAALLLVNLLHVVVGEQAPTYLGIERTRAIARYLAPGLYWWTRLLRPIIRAADWIAKSLLALFGVTITRSWTEGDEEDEKEPLTSYGAVRREIGTVLSRANLSRERRNEILRAVDIEEIPVRRIMVPRTEVVALSTASDLAETLQRMRAHPYDRYPLLGDDGDEVIGTLYMTKVFRHLPELERGNATLVDIAEPPVWVDPDLPVSDFIDRLQQEQQELAFVRAEKHVEGLVTTTDAFEAIAGELEDPGDVDRRETEGRDVPTGTPPAPSNS